MLFRSSGGEKNRLMLAVALAKQSNFLVLDEPTNDLDMDTLDLLQEVLSEYDGTVLLVSHDRDFIDRVVTSVIYMPGDGSVNEYAGSYSELLAKLQNKTPPKEEKKNAVKTQDKPSPATVKTAKLSYKQQRLLEILPQNIAQLETEITMIEAELGNPDLYTSDPEKFDTLSARLNEAQQEKEDSENQWLEIQLLKEELEAQ